MIVCARAPLRLGLAGGGTDIAAYADVHGGLVLNATLDRHAHAVLRTLDEGKVRFASTDSQESVELPLAPRLPLDGRLDLHKAVYNEVVATFNAGRPIALEVSTFCDAPAGSGLGSSSTLVVAMLRAFVELLALPLDEYAVASLAYKIERVDCGLQGGHQDQFSAAFGGLNFMEFHPGGRVVVNRLPVERPVLCELQARLLLYYTGLSRESARIIADQSANIEAGSAIEAMHGLKREAIAMRECLLRGDFDGIAESMHAGWESKKRSARCVSNPRIDEIYAAALAAGARAGKISGAGGGGYMMFFVPSDRRMELAHALHRFGGSAGDCCFSRAGMQAWTL